MWRAFLSAMQFLTIIPIPARIPFSAESATPFFPVIGLVIGLLLCWIDRAALMLWEPSVAAAIDVIVLVAVSGALHLDGLADTADGLYGRRPPDLALAIMKDSRIGSMGMIAVVLCLAAKWGGIYGLNIHRVTALVLVPAYSRAAVLFGMRLLPYGRPQGGTGQVFFQTPLKVMDFWAFLLVVLLSLSLGVKALAANIGFLVLVVLLLGFYRRRMGCITGDMLGAMIEVTEAALFLILSARIRL
jgi:adenosylcobinamide-GDP ribazoletransferase